jgi:phosphoglycolate phosphatase
MRPPAAVFLDLDGCLVDSMDAIANSINHALRAHGIAARPAEAIRGFIGPPLAATFRTIVAEEGREESLAASLVAAYRERYADMAAIETRVVPGVPEALADLSAGSRLAVVTAKPGVIADRLMVDLGLRGAVEAVFGPSLDRPTESKDETLGRALAAFDVTAHVTVMVGDREHDVLAGRACGTATVGVLWGAGDLAELEAAGADRVVTAPAELADAVTGVTRSRPASG